MVVDTQPSHRNSEVIMLLAKPPLSILSFFFFFSFSTIAPVAQKCAWGPLSRKEKVWSNIVRSLD